VFDGNRIYSIMRNNGQIVYQKGGDSGMYWPKRKSNTTICYASGFFVAGKVNGEPRTAAAEYESEWVAGKVLPNGEPDDPENPRYRMYNINRGDLKNPKRNIDFLEWPVEDGAPWIDQNGNGLYEPLAGDTPDLLGDQMIWYVMNDLDSLKHDNVFSSAPLGLECRVSIWGYYQPDALGDVMFCKFQLYNKANHTIDSCYAGLWADVDLGNASDDFSGCDTTLQMGYAYNDGPDDEYGVACPAIGFDFVQGVMVPAIGETGVSFGKSYPDHRNVGLYSFSKFTCNDDDYPDPETAQECWNYLAGFRYNGSPFIHPITRKPMVPVLYAPDDPVEGTGWLSALDHPSGDCRMMQSCGPFTMAPGDSQEVVVAVIIGRGEDHLDSVTELRKASRLAQRAMESNFQPPASPPAPVFKARGLDDHIIITWDDQSEMFELDDPLHVDTQGDPAAYCFQGYNIYQMETDQPDIGAATLIATFDLKDLVTIIKDWVYDEQYGELNEVCVQKGADTGIQRYFIVERDMLHDMPLINNRSYYFSVTSYMYNPDGFPRMLESEKNVVTVIPQVPFGERYNDMTVDDDTTIVVTHEGPGHGDVNVRVIDPSLVKPHEYQVEFYYETDEEGKASTDVLWKLTDTTENQVVLIDQIHQGDDEKFTVVDGILVQVTGPVPGLQSVYMIDDSGNVVDDGVSILEYSLGPPGFIFSNRAGEVNQPYPARDFDRFDVWGANDFEINFGEPSIAWQYTTDSLMTEKVPFSMYFHNFAAGTRERMYITIFDEGYGDATVEDGLGAWDTTGVDDLFGALAYEPIYGYISDIEEYDPAKEDVYIAAQFLQDTPGQTGWGGAGNPEYIPIFTAAILVDFLEAGLPETDNIIFYTTKPNTPKDIYSFSMAGYEPVQDDSLARVDIEKINVFPNPYFGSNIEERLPEQQFVRFTHLPDTDVIFRIYDLAGNLIRTIHHDNGTQYEEWNFRNEHSRKVASGVYIVHVDCGDLGQRILKLAVVMPD
ncbi:T9SS type A sorting domain-containing protein, partial [bacterium]